MSHTILRASIATLMTSASLSAFANTTDTQANDVVYANTISINANQLAHYQGQSVLDVLKNQANFHLHSHGSSNTQQGLTLRGFDNKNILVLIDGIRYGNLDDSATNLQKLATTGIERIDITQGASGTSTHGANAAGGTIAITTKKRTANDKKVSVTLQSGSHGQFGYGISTNLGNDNTGIHLSASHHQSDGFNAHDKAEISQADKDGSEQDAIALNINHKMGNIEIGASVLANQSNSEHDDSSLTTNPTLASDLRQKTKNGMATAHLTAHYSDTGSVRVQYGQSIIKDSRFAHGQLISKNNTQQEQTTISVKQALPIGTLHLGAEHIYQDLTSNNNYQRTGRTVKGGFASYQVSHNQLSGQIGVRHDHLSDVGEQTTYHVGTAYAITPFLRVGATHHTAFRAPTLHELYNTTANRNNPNLKVETSRNSEVFIEYQNHQHRTQLRGYHTTARNLITQDNGVYQNIDTATIKGASISSDVSLGKYLLGANYEYQDASNTRTQSELTDRPRHKGGMYVGYQNHGVDLRAEYQRVGGYYHGNNNQNRSAGYGMVNLSGTYQVSPQISMNTRINNLMNKKHTITYNDGSRHHIDGLNFQAGITLHY